MDQEQRDAARKRRSSRRPTRGPRASSLWYVRTYKLTGAVLAKASDAQFLWTAGIVAVLTVSILVGYRFHITLWDWLKLLIVPAVIAGGGLWFNGQQRERDHGIANARAQDEALQGYLDGMSQLLIDKEQPLHCAQPGDSRSILARARTLTVLGRLDSGRKRSVLQFLYEAGLIKRRHNIISLQQANLRGANLWGANWRGADLTEADLTEADLWGADLREADLSRATLTEADLSRADLREANMGGANMGGADFSQADLRRADLRGANLWRADLSQAKLGEADLREAMIWEAVPPSEKQLSLARLEDGMLMPNGQMYEDWLKSKDRAGD